MKQDDFEKDIRDSFELYDRDGNGSISLIELREVLRNLGEQVTDDEINQIIRIADQDGDGEIDYDEFVELLRRLKGDEKEDLRKAFDVFDQDGNGSISQVELKIVLDKIGIEMSDAELKRTMSEADTDGDGEISFTEFVDVVSREPVDVFYPITPIHFCVSCCSCQNSSLISNGN